MGLTPGSGRSPKEGNGNLLHCSCLENPMDRGTCQGFTGTQLKWLSTTQHRIGKGFPGSSDGREPACNTGELRSTSGWERSRGEWNGYPLQYSCLECIAIGLWWKRVFPASLHSKESASNAGDPGLTPGLGRSPGEGNGNPLQYYCLGNPMDRGA